MLQTLKHLFLEPILALKWRYAPLLLIYFAYGCQAITTVALTFWEKENLDLSAQQLVLIAAWLSFPWTIKMIFGQLVDHLPLFGSRRRAYVYIGAALMALGYVMLYGIATEAVWMTWMGSVFAQYLAANLVSIFGFVLQDVTADAMSTEVVDRSGQTEAAIQAELTKVQILGRLSFMIALAAVSGVGGYLAAVLPYEQVFLVALAVPLVSVAGAALVKLDTETATGSFDPVILGGGAAFAVFTLLMAFQNLTYSQEIVFVVSLLLLCGLMWRILKDQDPEKTKLVVLTLAAIFVFRMAPSTGPGFSWFAIDTLGFDEIFIGVLKQISALTALAVLWIGTRFIASQSVRLILIFLVVAETIISLPELALYYGWHELFGLSARTVALWDTAAEGPLSQISMIPMLAIIAFYAPAGNRATWFAVAASMMNLALTASTLIVKYLYVLFPVERASDNTEANYDLLGHIILTKIGLGFFVPLLAILVLLYVLPKKLPTTAK
jgi:MFS family permease